MKGNSEVQIVGDDNTIIVEDNGTSSLQTLWLEHWMNRVKLLIVHFARISFCQIYCVFNLEEDGISKYGIGEMDDLLFYEEL